MSSTPAQRFECPRCQTAFDEPGHFCAACGADMRAEPAPQEVTRADDSAPIPDRRLSDSNRAWLGKVVDGRYRVLEVIGRGGMGVVYKVEHLRMGKIAAMKVLHRDLAQDPEIVHRFEREAAAVSKLHHPHTVQVFDFGNANGALYLIMEYVRGLDLAHIINRDGPIPWPRCGPLFAQICGALQEAHELGIVHRDLKPENVLITRTTGGRDYAKVLDFGLAKLDQRGAPQRETERNAIVGTPYFMAPEQIRGDDVDARTDIYSFGALMFELLTGEHLYSGSTAVGVLTKHLTAEPDAPSMRAPRLAIPPAVDQICRKALARDPRQRWKTAAELGEAIEEVYAETVHDTTGPGARSSARHAKPLVLHDEDDHGSDLRLRRSDIDAFERSLKRQRVLALGGVSAVVLGGAVAAALLLLREPPPLTAEREPNDDVAHANKIAPGVPVTGYLGRRHSPTEADRDTYVVQWPAGSRRVVTIAVSALPNIDINLSVADGDGMHGATVDEAGVGAGEVLHRREVDGPLVVTVGETRDPQQGLPIENVSDAYTLTVSEDTLAGEAEPNNLDADANPLVLTEELRGYLDTRLDVDLLRWTGDAGTFNIVVRVDDRSPSPVGAGDGQRGASGDRGPPPAGEAQRAAITGLPMVWRLPDGKARTPGVATIELHKGDVIRLERSDRGGKGALVGRDVQWSVVVTK